MPLRSAMPPLRPLSRPTIDSLPTPPPWVRRSSTPGGAWPRSRPRSPLSRRQSSRIPTPSRSSSLAPAPTPALRPRSLCLRRFGPRRDRSRRPARCDAGVPQRKWEARVSLRTPPLSEPTSASSSLLPSPTLLRPLPPTTLPPPPRRPPPPPLLRVCIQRRPYLRRLLRRWHQPPASCASPRGPPRMRVDPAREVLFGPMEPQPLHAHRQRDRRGHRACRPFYVAQGPRRRHRHPRLRR
ncbi:hypothetical protein B0H14DRAFT_1010079 [Mycena olivaceomarginata]|nr:hypothetical protein B0H14DRAFT_1010079 [Mycena olivaceomarginata]